MQDEAQCRAAVFCRQKRASAACVNHHPVGKEMYVEVWFCRLTCSILRSKRSLPPENWQLLAGAASFCRQRKTIFCKECAVEISGFGSNMLCPGHYLYVFISGNYPHKNADFIPPNFAKFLLTFLDYSKIQIDLHWFCSINNANQGLKAREGGRKTAQKSRECKYVANKSHNTLLRCLRQ